MEQSYLSEISLMDLGAAKKIWQNSEIIKIFQYVFLFPFAADKTAMTIAHLRSTFKIPILPEVSHR
jgi:hypothetical protein